MLIYPEGRYCPVNTISAHFSCQPHRSLHFMAECSHKVTPGEWDSQVVKEKLHLNPEAANFPSCQKWESEFMKVRQ